MKEINTIGLRCPEPLMIVRRELRSLPSGEAVTITSGDPSTERDFELLCNNLGYILEDHKRTDTETGIVYFFRIRKP